ncbi:hypothetical protein NDU88_002932 [Pleurodeles waltl]|uniref:Uncharacterized protein n=1 Tax=Pleurodeles waltl TaxID=8319 RepID=A0AAV7UCM5_PLEWA|nr:hypothetical protein NDU88_002932 [Pleurodeles waltl]
MGRPEHSERLDAPVQPWERSYFVHKAGLKSDPQLPSAGTEKACEAACAGESAKWQPHSCEDAERASEEEVGEPVVH